MRNFREYEVWQKGMLLSKEIYQATATFPSHETFGLCSQMQRAGVSIPLNIAEGAGRESAADFAHFLDIALGSAYEVETQLLIAESLGYLASEDTSRLVATTQSIQCQLSTLIKKIRDKSVL